MRNESFIPFTAMSPLRLCRSSAGRVSGTTLCHNLRPRLCGPGLEPAGPPRPILPVDYPGASLLPGGEYIHPDGHKTLFLSYGSRLLCIELDTGYCLEGCDGPPVAVVEVGSSLLVMTGEGNRPMELYRENDRWAWRRHGDLPAPLAIVRKDEGHVSVTIDARSLRGQYSSRSTSLTAADTETFRTAMVEAYRSVGDHAASRGLFFQPVMAYVRYVGHDGRILYSSPPVIVAPSSGPQLTEATFTLSGGDFSQASAETVSADLFSLTLRQSAAPSQRWLQAVRNVELMVSPQFHPLEESQTPVCSLGRFTATAGSVTVMLPGAGDRSSTVGDRVLRPQVLAMLSRLSTSAFESAGSVRCDPSGLVGLDSLSAPRRRDAMDDVKKLRAALAIAVPSDGDMTVSRLSPPHSLNAAVTATGGDLVALASLSAVRFGGWLAPDFVTEAPQTSESGEAALSACRIEFADGSSSVRRLRWADGQKLGLLSPLLVYPSADAVALELYHGRRYRRFPLTPDASGRMACWLSPDMKPFELPETDSMPVIPAEKSASVSFPNLIGVASASLPLRLSAVTLCATAPPLAMVAAPGADGGWDSGAGRFYLFGRGGIQLLTVSSGGKRLNLRQLDGRPVESREAVCVMESAVAAVAGGDLVRVSGRKVTTLRAASRGTALGYDSRRAEIIVCHSADSPSSDRFTLPAGGECSDLQPDATVVSVAGSYLYSRSFPALSSCLSTPTGFRGVTSEGRVFDLLTETDEAVEAAFSTRLLLDSPCRASVRSLSLPLRGEAESVKIEIHADNGAGAEALLPVVSYGLNGRIVHLPPLRLFAPHAHAFSLTITLRARPSAIVL